MTPEPLQPRLFMKNKGHRNTVLNWHGAPENEFQLYGEAFWHAAKKLLENEQLDIAPIASFDASVIVYLYRHALELHLKEILIGRGSELVDPSPTAETVMNASHSLTKLLPDVRRILVECGWDKDFGPNAATFDDFVMIVEEFERADPGSFSFRYPVTKKLKPSLEDHFTFSVRQFAAVMDEMLTALSGACCGLPELADYQAEAAYEARCQALEYADPPEYEVDWGE